MSCEHWCNFVVGVEGRYSNDPDDSGAETWFGFTKGFLDLIGEKPPETQDDAVRLLKQYFWDRHDLAEMDELAAWCYGDALVNHNAKAAARCLQAGLGVKQDGAVGPITKAAAMNIDRPRFWVRYAMRRTRLFFAIARKRPKDVKYLNGWINRLHKLGAAAYEAIR